MRTRAAAIGGVGGPVAFVAAWALLGASAEGYAPSRDPISRLAALGAPTRVGMTSGFVAFALGLAVYALAARDSLSSRVGALAVANAACTLGVAALPLEGVGGGAPHALAAGAGYLTLAAMPAAAARPLSDSGRRRAAAVSRAVSGAALMALALSVIARSRTGLFQRAGLTVGDAWIVASAVWMLRGGRATVSGR